MRSTKLLNIDEVLIRCGRSPKSRQTIYDWMDEAGFPEGFQINGKGPLNWTLYEVDSWLAGQKRTHGTIVRRATAVARRTSEL
jgi:predicted DNA-binding transcriptional regulator AlpA